MLTDVARQPVEQLLLGGGELALGAVAAGAQQGLAAAGPGAAGRRTGRALGLIGTGLMKWSRAGHHGQGHSCRSVHLCH